MCISPLLYKKKRRRNQSHIDFLELIIPPPFLHSGFVWPSSDLEAVFVEQDEANTVPWSTTSHAKWIHNLRRGKVCEWLFLYSSCNQNGFTEIKLLLCFLTSSNSKFLFFVFRIRGLELARLPNFGSAELGRFRAELALEAIHATVSHTKLYLNGYELTDLKPLTPFTNVEFLDLSCKTKIHLFF